MPQDESCVTFLQCVFRQEARTKAEAGQRRCVGGFQELLFGFYIKSSSHRAHARVCVTAVVAACYHL